MKGLKNNKKIDDNDRKEKKYSSVNNVKEILNKAEGERQEIQDLNDKFQSYLSRVKQLDESNKKLNEEIRNLKSTWGFEEQPEDKNKYDIGLNELRNQIDKNAKEKIELDLKLKRAEYDIFSFEKGIKFLEFGNNEEVEKILELEAIRDAGDAEIENLENRLAELTSDDDKKYEDDIIDLMNKLEELKDEYDKQSLGRVQMQNELQTLEESIGFMKAINEEELDDLKTITSIHIDTASFYKCELARAIAAIRKDFDDLRMVQKEEMDNYYKCKMDEVQREIEDRKKKVEKGEHESKPEDLDLNELKEAMNKLQQQRIEIMQRNSDYESKYHSLVIKLDEVREKMAEAEAAQQLEFQTLQSKISEFEQSILAIVEGNVSLKFEILTYKRLLELEEERLASPSKGITTSKTKVKERRRKSLGFFKFF